MPRPQRQGTLEGGLCLLQPAHALQNGAHVPCNLGGGRIGPHRSLDQTQRVDQLAPPGVHDSQSIERHEILRVGLEHRAISTLGVVEVPSRFRIERSQELRAQVRSLQ